jgi:hypothetical protein
VDGKRTPFIFVGLILIALGVGPQTAAAATAQRAGGAAYHPRPGPDGVHPDLSGVWKVGNTANWDIEPHAARAALQMRAGPVIPVPAKEILPGGPGVVEGGSLPYTPAALKARNENRADYLDRDPEVKCYLPGIPRANYMPYSFQIIHSSTGMLFVYEYAGAIRNILFKDPGPAPADSWMGQSVGKWDGNTLVVTVTAQNDSTWFDRAGNFHSPDMTVVERWTLTSPTTMRYEATITDPATFTRPWKMSMNFYKMQGEDAQLPQFKCVEFVEETMYGKLRKRPLP